MDDKTKTYLKFAIAILVAGAAILAVVFGWTAPSVMTSSAVQVPVAVNTAIQIGIIGLLTAGFTWVFNTLGWDFRGLASVIGLALSTITVAELQNLINIIPVQFDPIVNTFLYFLVLILAPAGGLWLIKKKETGGPNTLL